ncbi:MAG: M56 family metallopeptidase [Bacteroidota bacterium]
MKDFALYALEANIYVALFAGLYYFSFRKDQNYMTNRVILIGSIVLAWSIPSFQLTGPLYDVIPQIELATIEIGTANAVSNNTGGGYPVDGILTLIYSLGVIIGLGLLLIQVLRIFSAVSSKKRESKYGFRFFSADSTDAWSFFNFLFLGDKIPTENIDWIVAHERVHYEEGHSLDKLVVLAAKVLGWFNPAVYYLNYALEENHEFRADLVVCKEFNNHTAYSRVLVSQAIGGVSHNLLSHQFSKKSMLKTRIQMINQTKQTGKMKYLLTIPVLAVALLLHSCTKEDPVTSNVADNSKNTEASDPNDMVFVVVEKMPEFKGGMEGLMNFMAENTVYPKSAAEADETGKVFVEFVIDEEGNVTNPIVLKEQSVSSTALHTAALETVGKMPAWTPGEQRGRKVKVKLTLPIKFELE